MDQVNPVKRSEIHLRHGNEFFIDGQWVAPRGKDKVEVLDSTTEEPFLTLPLAGEADMDDAIRSARAAFDSGIWPRTSPQERAGYLRAIAKAIRARQDLMAEIWVRESGVILPIAQGGTSGLVPAIYERYADLAETFPFEEEAEITQGKGTNAWILREPVGVVGAIVPWNAPALLTALKLAPALAAGCTMVLKAAPEAPGAINLMAEVAEEAGLPPGVLNMVTADRDVSERLVRDSRIDKIAFTGSTATGRRIASILGERIGRYTLELGGKSAAVVLDDFDIGRAAEIISREECFLSGQVCSSLTRIIVSRSRHDDMVEALASTFSKVRVGDPLDPSTQMGPLISERQRDRALALVERGKQDGAQLATGGGRPAHINRGWFMEPTVFGNVDNTSTLGREEVFGPVLSVIAAEDMDDAVNIANDSIYGLNGSVFTNDLDKAKHLLRRFRSGTAGHNDHHTDLGIAFGGYKQSGIGREGGREGIHPYLETKTMILDSTPQGGGL